MPAAMRRRVGANSVIGVAAQRQPRAGGQAAGAALLWAGEPWGAAHPSGKETPSGRARPGVTALHPWGGL